MRHNVDGLRKPVIKKAKQSFKITETVYFEPKPLEHGCIDFSSTEHFMPQ